MILHSLENLRVNMYHLVSAEKLWGVLMFLSGILPVFYLLFKHYLTLYITFEAKKSQLRFHLYRDTCLIFILLCIHQNSITCISVEVDHIYQSNTVCMQQVVQFPISYLIPSVQFHHITDVQKIKS